MKTCKYVHYELDPTPDAPPMMMGTAAAPLKPLKPQRAEYCLEVELGEAQWINCDIGNFRIDVIGQFGVIMADPPWDIHMELPYGTMPDDEMQNLNVPALQIDGLIFLWVTGRAMELGREWWLSLGNKLSGARLVEEGLQARFKPAYPDVEVQPASPPRASVMEVDLAAAHMRSPFAAADPKSASAQFSEPAVSGAMGVDIVS
ncbi:putative N6-adenosine-methyltransferase MT-A70-like isoform X2 [Syzygium oleosum]|uniref:putative N6-adenosine-methyltransferase MT-A70-like isoform X2 n=1 Tax=Syzygium oleosum TaxID=219896 RepID=UPI0024B9AF4C|nr:putative N6-adenosine-methyltransferase MT-A70-like isoform X2 [Syzygium oleosum]